MRIKCSSFLFYASFLDIFNITYFNYFVKNLKTIHIATFAYFSVTVTGNNTQTVVTGSTDKVATITYEKGTANAYLSVSATDMAQPEQNTDYYATTKESETDSTSGGIWIADGNNQVTTREDYKVIDLGGLKVENAGNETYSCTYTITLAKETGEENADELIDLLNSGDMILNISDIDEASNYDLSNLKSSNGTKTFTATFELTKDSNSKTFDATLHLVNKQGTNQSAFAGKKLNVKFTTSAECNIKKAETE